MKFIVRFLALVVTVYSFCQIETPTLCVNQSNIQGFGDLSNQYAFATEIFKSSVYVSTLNAANAPEGLIAFFLGEPFDSYGCQIYKGDIDLNTNQWKWNAVVMDGLKSPFNFGVRKFVVTGDYLYGTTANYLTGFEVWRTFDGNTWEVVAKNGFGDVENISGRGMVVFKEYLYVGAENRVTGAKLFRRKVEMNGDFSAGSFWEEIINDGIGDINNIWLSDFMIYNNYFYTGTLNTNGMQLWRTSNGIDFENIFVEGNGLPGNTAAMKLYVYRNKLYIGTMNFFVGASLWVNDDNEGISFVPVFLNGNGNPMNAYVWYLQEFQNRLYVGTFDMELEDENFMGFDLFSSSEPGKDEWIKETDNGFGNPGFYGIRNMAIIDNKLIIGTATMAAELGCIVFEATKKESVIVRNDTMIVKHNNINNMHLKYSNAKEMICNHTINATLHKYSFFKDICGKIA